MSKKLYVGNLPYSVRNEDLEQMFGEYGNVVSARVVTDRDSGRSKGFGFVEMGSEEEASNAVNQVNGRELEGRAIRVDSAQERPPRSGGGGGGGGRGGRGGGGGFRGGNRY